MNAGVCPAYLPSIRYIAWIIEQKEVVFVLTNHYQKQTYRNRTEIYGPNGKLKLTIPEGLQSDQVFENINALLDTEYDFKKYFNSKEIIQDLNITGKSLEGYLYPDTYYLYHDSSPGEIIEILLSEFWKQFDKNLIDRTNQLGFSVHQVVTLASIIEGEAMLSS